MIHILMKHYNDFDGLENNAPSKSQLKREATAVQTLGRDLADCLTFFRFPPRHWKRLRTSNALERVFKEVKRRTRVIGRFPTEISALSLVWSVMDQDADKWRGLVMHDAHLVLVHDAVRALSTHPIIVIGFEELLAA